MRQSPLFQLALCRVREFYREKEALFWVFVFPLLMTVALGVAFRDRPPDKVQVDVQAGAGAARLEQLLRADPRLEVAIRDAEECRLRLRRGHTDVVVAPNEPEPRTDIPPRVVLLYDVNRPTGDSGHNAVEAALYRAAHSTDSPAVDGRPVDEPGGRYIDWFAPGLIGVNLMGGGLWGVGYAVVDMRVRKLLKRYLATPMRKRDFLLSIVLSRMLFVVPEIALLLTFSRWFLGSKCAGASEPCSCLSCSARRVFWGWAFSSPAGRVPRKRPAASSTS